MKELTTGSDIGEIMRILRRDRGLTQRQLAARTGLSRPTLAKFETGPYSTSLSSFLKLLEVLDVRIYIDSPDDNASQDHP